MQINLTINLGGLMDDDLELDEEGNPIPKKKKEEMEDPMDMTLDGLLAGARDKYDWVQN